MMSSERCRPTCSPGFGGRWRPPSPPGATFHIQLLGVVSVGLFVFVVSFGLWKLLDKLVGVRVSYNVERLGQDAGELGMESYPEFVLMPEMDDEE